MTNALIGSTEPFSRPKNLAGEVVDPHSSTEHETWRLFLQNHSRFLTTHSKNVYEPYLNGFRQLELPSDRIPTTDMLNRRLLPTGWGVTFIEGDMSSPVYRDLLSRKRFPIAMNMRQRRHLYYSPTPDVVHDIIGHLPMLFHGPFREFLEHYSSATKTTRISQLDAALYEANLELCRLKSATPDSQSQIDRAQGRVDAALDVLARSPSAYTRYSRLYAWSVEFGLIGSTTSYKIFGAGLLSSHREALKVLGGKTKIKRFTEKIFSSDINMSAYQSQLFVSDNFGEYNAALLSQH